MPLCPSCRKPVDERLTRCPWDGTILGTVIRDPMLGTFLVGRYLLRKCVAERGPARLYSAEEEATGRQVVATVLPPRAMELDDETYGRFRARAEAARTLEHTACTQIRDFGRAPDGSLYLIEDGELWHQLAQEIVLKGRLPFSQALDLGIQLVEGLDHLHAKGLDHASLAPASLRLTFDAQGALRLQIPVAEIVLRTVLTEQDPEGKAYASSTELAGPTADLFSAALILVEMLTGQGPTALGAGIDWSKLSVHVEPDTLAGLQAIIERALQLSGEPFASAWEMRRELESLTGRSRLGRYGLLHRIAVGGMGEIYLARAEGIEGIEIDRFCVIKTIRTNLVQSSEFVERFLAEARVLASLSHGNIVQVHDVGKAGSVFYIAMEYVAGKDLRKVLNRAAKEKQRMPVPLALFVAKELANGLAYAHRAKVQGLGGLVHRDVSPHNTIVSYEGEVKLIDFGLAKGMKELSVTRDNVVMGKVCYISPEQARAESLDQRTDIYSAGLVLFEMLTGEPFFNQPTIEEVLAHVASPQPEPPSDRNPEVPPEVDRICLRAMAPRREDRYRTAGALRDDLTAELARLAPRTNPEEVGAFVHALFPSAKEEEETLLSDLSQTLPPVSRPQAPPPRADGPTLPEEVSDSEALSLLGRTPFPIHLAANIGTPALQPVQPLPIVPPPLESFDGGTAQRGDPTLRTAEIGQLEYRPRSRWPIVVTLLALILGGGGVLYGLRLSREKRANVDAERAAFRALASWRVGQPSSVDGGQGGDEADPDAGLPDLRPRRKLQHKLVAIGTPRKQEPCLLELIGGKGMEVSVDGVGLGVLPLRPLTLKAGVPHVVVVKRGTAVPYTQRVSCSPGEQLRIRLGTTR